MFGTNPPGHRLASTALVFTPAYYTIPGTWLDATRLSRGSAHLVVSFQAFRLAPLAPSSSEFRRIAFKGLPLPARDVQVRSQPSRNSGTVRRYSGSYQDFRRGETCRSHFGRISNNRVWSRISMLRIERTKVERCAQCAPVPWPGISDQSALE